MENETVSTGHTPAKAISIVALALSVATLSLTGDHIEARASADNSVAHTGKSSGKSAATRSTVAVKPPASASVKPLAQLAPDAEAEATPQGTSAVAQGSAEDGIDCHKRRKRLFVDGYGWVVRRVTICE
jgi:hypothetical protein